MLLYRVFRYLSTAKRGESGHPEFLYKPQGKGRWDNPGLYDAWYLARHAECAVGESFADLSEWRDAMFEVSIPAGGRYALGTFEVADDLPLFDCDDPRNLLDSSLRPTQIVSPIRPVTQAIAQRIFAEKKHDGSRGWAGLSWWSLRWCQWNPVCLWVPSGESLPARFVRVETLDIGHPAVLDAARTLTRVIH